jgi:hypothetical protein
MNTLNTQGEWSLAVDDDNGELWVVSGMELVCMVAHECPSPQDFADARLIAAAPDMLAALLSILEDGGRVTLDVRENLMVWSGDMGALSKARAAARAAIAKATGGEA